MTSDLEKIAAIEHAIFLMQQAYGTDLPSYNHNLEKWIPALGEVRAWITANKESPQRKAFVEAAMEWGENGMKWDKAREPDDLRALRNEAHEICRRMDLAFRAMKEAEKVEAERGEGMVK